VEDFLLKVENLHTYFHSEAGVVKAVNGVDFIIRKGETLGLVGESGCGKSVTALSIMGLVPKPQGKIVKGRIVFGDQDLLKLGNRAMRDIRGNLISMIFQEPMASLNPVYRVGRQIAEAILLHKDLSRQEARARTEELLTKVGIADPTNRAREYPHQMSGGMRQRVMIAMALACNPKLIIADEPTTALDVTIQAQILELMNDLKADFGGSILLITHDLGVVAEMAQWVAVMYTGQIVEYAEVAELFGNPCHPYTTGLMASIPDIESEIPNDRMLQVIAGVVPSLLNLPAGCSFEKRCSKSHTRCRKENAPLRQVKPGHWVRCWNHG
jgi:peptide/nickel transport system ATP-binding protein/oligopeptide transport system ATP-binding protein